MRLRGIHNITSRWSQASRKRAIADLAENARRSSLTEPQYREILDRIYKIGVSDASFLEQERAYIIKGSRFQAEDEVLIPAENVYQHRKLLHYPESLTK